MRRLLLIATIIVALMANYRQPSDYDLGWHMRYGRDVLTDGVIWRPNTYSATLVGYRWINSSWGLDVFRYLFFSGFGFTGFAVLGAIVATATPFVFLAGRNVRIPTYLLLTPLCVYLLMPLNIHSFRGQPVSLLFTGILFWLFARFERGKTNSLWWTIPLFLFWANVQGQFVVAIAIYGIWTTVHAAVTFKKEGKHGLLRKGKVLFAPLLCSATATLVTPFGIFLYTHDIISHIGNPAVYLINEFMPITPANQYLFWWMIGIGIVIGMSFVMARRNRDLTGCLPYLAVVAVLYPASFNQSRYLWILVLSTLPLAAYVWETLAKGRKAQTWLSFSLISSIALWYVVFNIWSIDIMKRFTWDGFCERAHCSMKALPVIQKLAGRRIYTDYNIGGWMIWQTPDVPPVIDGRMPLWRDDQGFSPFLDLYKPVETVTVHPDKAPFDAYVSITDRPLTTALAQLMMQKKTWQAVYHDNLLTIFVRNQRPATSSSGLTQ